MIQPESHAADIDPRDHDPVQFLARITRLGESEATARRWLSATIGRGILDPVAWNQSFQIPKRLTIRAVDPLPRLRLEHVSTSKLDGFEKLLLRTIDGLSIETVLIPLKKPGAVSVCVSSQVGCAMGCVYCATARMTSRRNLAVWEIIDQFHHARARAVSQGRRVTGVVFMGMGEPFLNYDRVLAAAELLSCPFGGSVGGGGMTISTVGLVPEIDRFTAEKRRFRLSISLGAASDEKRAMLVPVAARSPIREVVAAAARHARARNDRVMLSYVCIHGVNVGEDDARDLGELLAGIRVRFDLIDVVDPTGRYKPPEPDELKRFRDLLSIHLGQPVVRRYSGGADIQAACGTLAGATAL